MADNITTLGGSVATDDVAGAHFQRVKLDIGGDGVSSPVTAANPVPVSGTVAISNASLAVTGAFFQATQPISGAVSVSNFPASQAVTGTFWQATQPVSIAALPSLAAGSATIGTTLGPALTKGTQGATGYSTQDLKDAGRVSFAAATVIAGVTAVTAEALLSMVPVRGGTASAAATSQAVTSGKRLRLQSITVGFISTAAAVLSMRFALRMNPTGAVTATSPILRIIPLSQQAAALAQAGNEMTVDFPDGIEFSGTEQFGLTQIGSAATGTCWASFNGFEY